MTQHTDVVVVGGGQAGLAAGYHLHRQGIDFTILGADPAPGGAWQHMWDSLHLFSPADHSSLPGRLMPTHGTRVLDEPRLYLLGYGDWTGPASATLIGVGRTARDAAQQIRSLVR